MAKKDIPMRFISKKAYPYFEILENTIVENAKIKFRNGELQIVGTCNGKKVEYPHQFFIELNDKTNTHETN